MKNTLAFILLMISIATAGEYRERTLNEMMTSTIVPKYEVYKGNPIEVLNNVIAMIVATPPTQSIAIHLVTENAKVPITIDGYQWEMDGHGIERLPPLTLSRTRISLGELLGLVLSALSYTCEYGEDSIAIITSSGKRVIIQNNVEQGDGECLLRRK